MKRNEFLKLSGGFALAALASKSAWAFNEGYGAKKLKAFGLQLYTLRADLPKDPKGVLKQVADFGYKQIEGYEGPKGMFWGMTHKEFKAYMDELGTNFISSHCDITKDFEKKVSEAAEIGMKYLIYPYEGPNKKMDDYKKLADDFNKKGELCKKNGIRFAFHNHDHSFVQIEGQFPQEVMMNMTDPGLVDFELDMYWVVTSGQDIETWMKKYPNRFRLCHVKDREKNATERMSSCVLGTGSIDYPSILKKAKKLGMQFYIVEQEKYQGTTPLKAAEDCAAYMKKLSI